LEQFYRRLGFMIPRVHQIAVSLFLEEAGRLGISNRQRGILFALKHRPGIDQISVAKLLGLDRSTTGMVPLRGDRVALSPARSRDVDCAEPTQQQEFSLFDVLVVTDLRF
jgi:hypothetical protein